MADHMIRTRDVRATRQIREYADEPVSDADLAELLEVARWTGSGMNSQPWHFIVVRNPGDLAFIASQRPPIGWVEHAPLAIAIVLDGRNETGEAYEEGRVTERLLISARLLGLGAGIAWIGEPEMEERVKERLGVPAERTLRSVVAIGRPKPAATHKLGRRTGGRKPLDEIVSYDRFPAS